MRVATGTYTGNGSDNRAITVSDAVGSFQPDFVMVKGASNALPAFRTSAMSGDLTAVGGALLTADIVQSLDATGFTIGTHAMVNTNLTTYHWLAIKADPLDCKVGTYTGNASDNRSITGVGFQPSVVMIFADRAEAHDWRSDQHSGDVTGWLSMAGSAADKIQSLTSDGFTVGTHGEVNGNASNYYYVAFKTVAGFFKTGTYTGNGADNRSITGVGFQPAFVHVARGATSAPRFKLASHSGEITGRYSNDGNDATDYIQALEADGFQIGTNAVVNANTETFRYFAIKAGNSVVSGGSSTGGKGKGKSGKPPGGNQPPGKLKTFGVGRWPLGGRRLW